MSSTSSYVSEKPVYGKAAWLSTVSSVICGYFSYGFIRGWPNYWSNMQNHLNDCNERGQNCTQEQFLHRDQEHSDWSAEVGNNTLHPDWVTKDHISSTSSFMLLGVSIGATLCGLILPMIGNRKATMQLWWEMTWNFETLSSWRESDFEVSRFFLPDMASDIGITS